MLKSQTRKTIKSLRRQIAKGINVDDAESELARIEGEIKGVA